MEKQKITTTLLSFHQKVEKKLETEKVFKEAVKILKNFIKCDGCAIILFGRKKAVVVSEIGFFKNLKMKEFSKDMPAIKYIIKTGKSVFTNNIKNSKFKSCIPEGCRMNSLMCVPLKINGKIKGMIHLDSLENKFSKDDLNLVKLLSSELSRIIEKSIIYTKMKKLSSTDHLTGCFSRRVLYTDLKKEIIRSERYNKVFSIIMIDVDNFKKYNDKFGHQKGDALLKKVVSKIKKNLRKIDTIYRFGGDEFVILLPETDKEGAKKVTKKIKEEIERMKIKTDEETKIIISTGIATFIKDGKKTKELLEKADQNMYREKFRKKIIR